MKTATIKLDELVNGRKVIKLVAFGVKTECNDEDETYEVLYIKYGDRRNLELCSAYIIAPVPNCFVYLSASVTGNYGDIILTSELFINILTKLGSKILLSQWVEKLKIQQVA